MNAMEIIRMQPAGLVVSPAFSHVAVVPAGATTIYVGGQNGVDATGVVVSSDIAAQSSRAIDNASIALEAAGASLADVVQWSVLIAQTPTSAPRTAQSHHGSPLPVPRRSSPPHESQDSAYRARSSR
jgi:enamine deaminase RidA (YjgF/YER057c/UK114 family)